MCVYYRADEPIANPIVSSLKVGYIFETAFLQNKTSAAGGADEPPPARDYVSEAEKEIVAEESDRNTELWTNREVVLAAKVLSADNPKRHGIKFVSDNQMRRVYDIIFEVFRCEKPIF